MRLRLSHNVGVIFSGRKWYFDCRVVCIAYGRAGDRLELVVHNAEYTVFDALLIT